MKYAFLFLSLVLCLSAKAQTYQRNYEVKSSDKLVGKISATRKAEGDYVQYNVTSHVEMTILFTVNVDYKLQATYKNDVLVSSSATVYLNGRTQSDLNCERTGDHYTLVSDGHTTRIYEDIKWSSAKLYFNRPDDVRKVFSETDGSFKNLSKTADGKFILKDAENDKNVNTYTYSSDQGLHEILIERALLPTLKVIGAREVILNSEKDKKVESED